MSLTAGYAQKQELVKANRLFAEYAYTDAADAYEAYLKKAKKPGKETIRKIADTYYYIGRYEDASLWYAKLSEASGTPLDDKYFNRYIQSLLMDGNVKKNSAAKADEMIKARLLTDKNKKFIAEYTQHKKQLDSINAAPPVYTVTHLEVNSGQSDFGTAFLGDKIVYSSSKDLNKAGRKIYKWNEQPFLELYVADRDTATGALVNEAKFFPSELNNYHNATLTLSNDGTTVYFSTNTVKNSGFLNNAANGTNNLQILKAKLKDGKLEDEVKLTINKISYSVAHPALTPDGKWMFFTSDMPGGLGETDIYVAPVLENGQLGEAENLGPAINTIGKDMFPFVSNNTLYFSTDSRYGMGGLDIYKAPMTADMKFGTPVNLGSQVNSNRDDFAYIINNDQSFGYFSSNRKGGKGDDDIYYFTKKPEPCTQLIAGTVQDAGGTNVVANATVTVHDINGNAIASVITKSDGSYSVQVACGQTVRVVITKDEHTVAEQQVTTGSAGGNPVKVDVALSKYNDVVTKTAGGEIININPIYFDLDKYNITPLAEAELDKVVAVMKGFPSMVIKIESHTDSRQTHKYNVTLSENRAKSTYNYLLSKGIDAKRIESVRGYGETRLLNSCSNEVPCSEEEHQLNRRSDFVIVRR